MILNQKEERGKGNRVQHMCSLQLTKKIRNNKNVKGITIDKKENKMILWYYWIQKCYETTERSKNFGGNG